MKYKITIATLTLTLVSILILLIGPSCACNETAGESRQPMAEGTFNGKLVAANNRFGFDLFNQLQLKDKGHNIFYSPLSVVLALSMTYNGAAGETGEAMQRTLGIEGMSLDEINQA